MMVAMMRSTDRVPVDKLRRTLSRKYELGTTWSDMARALGWIRKDQPDKADTTRLQRTVGVSKWSPATKRAKKSVGYAKTIDYSIATEICEALDLDPVDMGL